jgi:hypothetical protein
MGFDILPLILAATATATTSAITNNEQTKHQQFIINWWKKAKVCYSS